jgi:hypothetical protein
VYLLVSMRRPRPEPVGAVAAVDEDDGEPVAADEAENGAESTEDVPVAADEVEPTGDAVERSESEDEQDVD